VSEARIAELERLLEESERERTGLLEAVRDTLHLQQMAEEAGNSSEPVLLLGSFVQALGKVVPWRAAEVRLRESVVDRKLTRTVLREGFGQELENEILELDEEAVLGWALEANRPTLLPSLGDSRGSGWLVVPLVVQGADIGFALLRPVAAAGTLTAHHLEMVRLIAAQTAVALDNIAHIDEIRHGYGELRSLHRVASSLGRSLDLEKLFDTLKESLRERMDPRIVALGIFHADGEPMRLMADGASPESCQGILSRIAASGASLRLDVGLKSGQDLAQWGCRRALGFPLVHGGEGGACLGALLVAESEGNQLEAPDAVDWLEALSHLLAASVDNARLFEDVVTANRRMSDLQSRMIQAGKLAGIGQLAGGIAHEINNPLQVILGRVQILQVRNEGHPEVLADLSRVESEIMRIAHIVRSLQNFAHQEGCEPQGKPSRLSNLTESVLELIAHRLRRQGISVARIGFEDSPQVSGDLEQLRHVVLNLCLNAIQAMPEGGTLTLEARIHEDQAVLEVSDTGSGIRPEDLDKIFDPFFARTGGMGLGLAIGFAVAQRHGGSLHAVPGLAEGAKFRLILPLHRPDAILGAFSPG
jgi:signal transduction histidine kinase